MWVVFGGGEGCLDEGRGGYFWMKRIVLFGK